MKVLGEGDEGNASPIFNHQISYTMSSTINQSEIRVGNFTSSEIHKLMSNGKKAGELGKPFFTYVEEKQMERRLGRSLSEDVTARALSWGLLLEKRVFNLLGIDYKESSQETIVHPRYDFWVGSPDGQEFDEAGDKLAEIKCPLTLKSFCQLVDCIKEGLSGLEIMNLIRENHTDGDKFYWQCVSNAILTGSKCAELIVYMPYKSELAAIRFLATNYDGFDQWKFKWIDQATDEELPFLIEGGYYKNLNKIMFEVPEADKALLTERVLMAQKLLKS